MSKDNIYFRNYIEICSHFSFEVKEKITIFAMFLLIR